MRDRADAAEADRDYWRTQATMAAPCVDAIRALATLLIPGGTGCVVDPERVVAAVESERTAYEHLDRLASRQAGEYMEAAHGLATDRDAARRAATLAEMERDTLRALTDSLRADNVRLRAYMKELRASARGVLSALEFYDPDGDDETEDELNAACGDLDVLLLAGAPTPALDAAGEGR